MCQFIWNSQNLIFVYLVGVDFSACEKFKLLLLQTNRLTVVKQRHLYDFDCRSQFFSYHLTKLSKEPEKNWTHY